MPVIRIDEEVWKELQKRSEPLVDTPNSVLRRVFNLMTGIDASERRTLEIVLKTVHSLKLNAQIPIPKRDRGFFPGYQEDFTLNTDIGTVATRVTGAPAKTPKGDPAAGTVIQGSLTHWFEKHPTIKEGDILRFEMLADKGNYRLSLHQT